MLNMTAKLFKCHPFFGRETTFKLNSNTDGCHSHEIKAHKVFPIFRTKKYRFWGNKLLLQIGLLKSSSSHKWGQFVEIDWRGWFDTPTSSCTFSLSRFIILCCSSSYAPSGIVLKKIFNRIYSLCWCLLIEIVDNHFLQHDLTGWFLWRKISGGMNGLRSFSFLVRTLFAIWGKLVSLSYDTSWTFIILKNWYFPKKHRQKVKISVNSLTCSLPPSFYRQMALHVRCVRRILYRKRDTI